MVSQPELKVIKGALEEEKKEKEKERKKRKEEKSIFSSNT